LNFPIFLRRLVVSWAVSSSPSFPSSPDAMVHVGGAAEFALGELPEGVPVRGLTWLIWKYRVRAQVQCSRTQRILFWSVDSVLVLTFKRHVIRSAGFIGVPVAALGGSNDIAAFRKTKLAWIS
jgi:hypothetical protein